MQDRGAPHLESQQGLETQLEADGEEQQQHARMRELAQHRRGMHAERAEDEPGCEEPDEGRKTDAPCREAERQRYRDPNGDHA